MQQRSALLTWAPAWWAPSDLLLIARIALFAAAVPLLFRLPIQRLDGCLARFWRAGTPSPERTAQIVRCTDMVCRAGRRWIPRYCLTRGLTLCYFLRRAHLPVSLVFGIGIGGEKTADVGHCWLTLEGEPYLEKVDPRTLFATMYVMAPRATTAGRR